MGGTAIALGVSKVGLAYQHARACTGNASVLVLRLTSVLRYISHAWMTVPSSVGM